MGLEEVKTQNPFWLVRLILFVMLYVMYLLSKQYIILTLYYYILTFGIYCCIYIYIPRQPSASLSLATTCGLVPIFHSPASKLGLRLHYPALALDMTLQYQLFVFFFKFKCLQWRRFEISMLYLSENLFYSRRTCFSYIRKEIFPLNSQIVVMKPLLYDLLLALQFCCQIWIYCVEFYIYTLFIY